MIPVRKAKNLLTLKQEEYFVQHYNGWNSKQLAQKFGVTLHYIGLLKRKYNLFGMADYDTKPVQVEVDNGIFNVHNKNNWVI